MTDYAAHFIFRDQSPSFARGFVLGQINQRMKDKVPKFDEMIVVELQEDVIAMATTYGYKERFEKLNDDYLQVYLELDAESGSI